MANDNKKTKNNAPCEERQETRELFEDYCPVCGGKLYELRNEDGHLYLQCEKCEYRTRNIT